METSSKMLIVVSYCFGDTITNLAEQSGASPASVFRWIEEARESIKGDGEMVGWMIEAFADAVDFALEVEKKRKTLETVSAELLHEVEWLNTLFENKRSSDGEFVPNFEALGWMDASRSPTDAEFTALLTMRIEEIRDALRDSDYEFPSLCGVDKSVSDSHQKKPSRAEIAVAKIKTDAIKSK